MLTRVSAAIVVTALLASCARVAPSVPPPVRDVALPGASGSRPASASPPSVPTAPASPAAAESAVVTSPRPMAGPAGVPRPRAAPADTRASYPAQARPLPQDVVHALSQDEVRDPPRDEVRSPPAVLPPGPNEGRARTESSAVAALVESARAAEEAHAYARAVSALERALKVEPRNPDLWHHLAAVRFRQGRHDEAEALARRSMSFARGDADLESRNWRIIAAARAERGDEEGARAALRRADEH